MAPEKQHGIRIWMCVAYRMKFVMMLHPICWQSYRSSVHLRKDTVKKIVDCHKPVMYISKSSGTVSTVVFVSRHIHPDIWQLFLTPPSDNLPFMNDWNAVIFHLSADSFLDAEGIWSIRPQPVRGVLLQRVNHSLKLLNDSCGSVVILYWVVREYEAMMI